MNRDQPKCREPWKPCFANSEGHCTILISTQFKKGCPFFRDADEVEKERKKARSELAL